MYKINIWNCIRYIHNFAKIGAILGHNWEYKGTYVTRKWKNEQICINLVNWGIGLDEEFEFKSPIFNRNSQKYKLWNQNWIKKAIFELFLSLSKQII